MLRVSQQTVQRRFHLKQTWKLSPLFPEMSGPGKVPSATTVLYKRVSSAVDETKGKINIRARESVGRQVGVDNMHIAGYDCAKSRACEGERNEQRQSIEAAHHGTS